MWIEELKAKIEVLEHRIQHKARDAGAGIEAARQDLIAFVSAGRCPGCGGPITVLSFNRAILCHNECGYRGTLPEDK